MNKLFTVLLLFLFLSPSHAQRQSAFSGANALNMLRHLSVDIGPRVMGSPADQCALEYAVNKFREYGCDTAYFMPMMTTSRANTTSGIAIGIKKGATNRIICLGSHMDSAGPEIPGADDDGSGAAVVLELANVLCKQPLRSTIVFCCFSGEEQGLEGSRYFVDHFPQINNVDLMLQADMANGLGVIDLDPDTHLKSAPKWLVRAAVEEFYALGYEHLEYPTHFFSLNYGMAQSSGSDHESFLEIGIPAIDFSTDVTKPIHTPRDNFENFEPGGLQRTGDLLYRLVHRFDNGVPPGKTDRYWLYLIGSTPVFLPLSVLWIISGIALFFGILTIIVLYDRRPAIDPAQKIRWSRLKILMYSTIIISFAWFSPDIITLFQGVRHPWMMNEQYYFVYAAFAFLIGVTFTSDLNRRMPVTKSALPLFLSSALILIIYTLLLLFFGVKAGIYPALGLLFLSLALLINRPSFKFVFLLLAPLPLLRLIFSEWALMFIRILGAAGPNTFLGNLAYNGGFVAFFTIMLLPFSFGFAAVVRDTPVFSGAGAFLRSKPFLALALIPFIAMTLILIKRPGYSKLWNKAITVNEKIDLTNRTQEIRVKSSEFMNGILINHGGTDTVIGSKATNITITPKTSVDTTWFRIERNETKSQSGDTSLYDITLRLISKFRPYTITATYDGGTTIPRGFTTPWFYQPKKNTDIIRWVSFPDTNIVVPLKFRIVGSDTLHETISVMFDTLAYPLQISAEQTYVISRTEFISEHTYRK